MFKCHLRKNYLSIWLHKRDTANEVTLTFQPTHCDIMNFVVGHVRYCKSTFAI